MFVNMSVPSSLHPSLQVAVHLEAVVPRVGHHHVAVWGEGEALGTVQGVCWGVDVGQEGAAAIKHLGGREMYFSLVFHILIANG